MQSSFVYFFQQALAYASQGWKFSLVVFLILYLSWLPTASFAEKQGQSEEKILPKEAGERGVPAASEEKDDKALGEKRESSRKSKSDAKKGAESRQKKEKSNDKVRPKEDEEKNAKNKHWPPLNSLISSPFGVARSINGGGRHSGLDIRAHLGWPVCSLADGVVTFTGRRGRAGITVIIQQDNGKTASYCHLSRCLVTEGTKVQKGCHIGLVGCTGRTTGVHLHLSMRKNDELINPRHELSGAWEVFDPPLSELNGGVIEAQSCDGAIQYGSGPANAGLGRASGVGGFNPRLDGDRRYLRVLKETPGGLYSQSYSEGRGKRVPRLRGNAQYVRMRKALRGLNTTGYTPSKLRE